MSDPRSKLTVEVRIGNHLYGKCRACQRWVKLTGFWKGFHLCATPECRK